MATYFQDKTVQDLDKLLSQAKGLRLRFEGQWYLGQMFFLGDQWLF